MNEDKYEEPYEWYGRSCVDPRCPDCGEYVENCTCEDEEDYDERE